MRKVILGALFAAPLMLRAQAQNDPRSPMPERPTVATHAFTVAPRYVELETGIERDDIGAGAHSWVTPIYVKIGLATRAQLGISAGFTGATGVGAGVSDMTLALKYRLADNVPVLGAIAVLPAIKLPVADATHGTTTTDASVLFISSHKFGDAALDVNVGVTKRSGDGSTVPKTSSLWTVSGGVPLAGPVGLAIEVFGFPGTSGVSGAAGTVALLAGPTIGLGSHTVADLGVIRKLHGPQTNALYAGVTYNIGHF